MKNPGMMVHWILSTASIQLLPDVLMMWKKHERIWDENVILIFYQRQENMHNPLAVNVTGLSVRQTAGKSSTHTALTCVAHASDYVY